jgi:hypothetical protein
VRSQLSTSQPLRLSRYHTTRFLKAWRDSRCHTTYYCRTT